MDTDSMNEKWRSFLLICLSIACLMALNHVLLGTRQADPSELSQHKYFYHSGPLPVQKIDAIEFEDIRLRTREMVLADNPSYRIQTGSFIEYSHAETHKLFLEDKGLSVVIDTINTEHKTRYKAELRDSVNWKKISSMMELFDTLEISVLAFQEY